MPLTNIEIASHIADDNNVTWVPALKTARPHSNLPHQRTGISNFAEKWEKLFPLKNHCT